MLNQFYTVGRMVSDVIMLDDNRANVRLSVPSPIKNEYGDYECNDVEFMISGKMIDIISKNCKKGDLLGVKGFLTSQEINGVMMPTLMTKNITFLSSKTLDNNEDLKPKLEEDNIAI